MCIETGKIVRAGDVCGGQRWGVATLLYYQVFLQKLIQLHTNQQIEKQSEKVACHIVCVRGHKSDFRVSVIQEPATVEVQDNPNSSTEPACDANP